MEAREHDDLELGMNVLWEGASFFCSRVTSKKTVFNNNRKSNSKVTRDNSSNITGDCA